VTNRFRRETFRSKRQIISNLLMDLQQKLGLSYLCSSLTDLRRRAAHRDTSRRDVFRPHSWKLATAEDLYADRKTSYTEALLSAVPVAGSEISCDPKTESCYRRISAFFRDCFFIRGMVFPLDRLARSGRSMYHGPA